MVEKGNIVIKKVNRNCSINTILEVNGMNK